MPSTTIAAVVTPEREQKTPLDPMTIPSMATTSPLIMTLEQIQEEKERIHSIILQFSGHVDSQHPRFQALEDRRQKLDDEILRRRNIKFYSMMAALAASPGIALGGAWSFFRGGSVLRGGITGGIITVALPVAWLLFINFKRQG
jgi:hypothetical protein